MMTLLDLDIVAVKQQIGRVGFVAAAEEQNFHEEPRRMMRWTLERWIPNEDYFDCCCFPVKVFEPQQKTRCWWKWWKYLQLRFCYDQER